MNNNFNELKNQFNNHLNNSKNFGNYFKTLKGYESLLNLSFLIKEEDIKEIEDKLTNTSEYDTLRYFTDPSTFLQNLELKKERIQESFEELQKEVEKMVFEKYKEREEEWSSMDLSIKSIDELAIAFKDGTWTFTPIHIEEDGNRSIVAHSVEVNLNLVKKLFLEKEPEGDSKNTLPPSKIPLMLNYCNNIEVKTKEELQPDMGLEI